MRTPAAPLLWVLAALGCDPIMGVQGEVRSVPRSEAGRRAMYDSGQPIREARIVLLCPKVEEQEFAKTKDDGTFSAHAIGWLSTECTVEVRAPGYHPERFSLADLCVFREGGTSCHFANISAELVPTAPHAGDRPVPEPPKPVHRVEFTAHMAQIHISERAGEKFGQVEYRPLGVPPFTVEVGDGKHRFAATLKKRAPVEAPDIVVSGPTRVELDYVDRSTLRAWKRGAFATGLIVGPVLAGVGFEAEGAAKPILIGTGIVIALSGILFGMDANETTDQLRTRVTPLPARPRPAESASTQSPR